MFRIKMPGPPCFDPLYAVWSDRGGWWLTSDPARATTFRTMAGAEDAKQMAVTRIRFVGEVEEVPCQD